MDKIRASGPAPNVEAAAEQSLRDAFSACRSALRREALVPDWLRIPSQIGGALAFGGFVILAFRHNRRKTSVFRATEV